MIKYADMREVTCPECGEVKAIPATSSIATCKPNGLTKLAEKDIKADEKIRQSIQAERQG